MDTAVMEPKVDNPISKYPEWEDLANRNKVIAAGLNPNVWREVPATIEEWIDGEEYLNLRGVIRSCVREDICKFFERNDRYNPWSRKFEDAIFCEGIGSGKSFKVSVMTTYFLHLMLCLRKPQTFFKCSTTSKLAIMNMCFAGNQNVRLQDGTEVTFESLFKSQEEILVTSFDKATNSFMPIKAKPCVESGVRKIKKITFGNGRVLRLTDNHPLLARKKTQKGKFLDESEWKPVSGLEDGDLIKVGKFLGHGKPSGLSSDEIKLLAYVLGDSQLIDGGVQFLSSYKRVVADFKEVSKRFNVTKFKEHDKGDLHCIIVRSAEILAFLNKMGMVKEEPVGKIVNGVTISSGAMQKVLVKRIPECLIGADENEVLLFLNRLWATYGSVNIGHKVSINFTNPSEEFVKSLADILSRFDVVCRYYKNNGKFKTEDQAEIYRLCVSDVDSKIIFMEKIGRFGLKLEGCQMVKGNLGEKFSWVNIQSIVDDGEEMTYDIEVPVHNNLVVNGIVCHNSVSAHNAAKVIFSEIKQKIDECPWFQAKGWDSPDSRVPDPMCLSELRFKNNLFIIPGSSNWRSTVGYNIIVGIVDEAGNYRANDNSDQAEEIYTQMKRRLGSRFESNGACIVAGSPMYESDFLERKIHEAEEAHINSYVKRRTLWEAKYPDWKGDVFYVDKVNNIMHEAFPEGGKIKDFDVIPKVPFLYQAFKQNVYKAYRDFGARPSISVARFFEQPKRLLDQANTTRPDPLDSLGRFKEWFKPVDKTAYHAIHVDIGLTGDALGLALGHFNGYTNEGGIKIYVDLMWRVKGSSEKPIQISDVREFIYGLTGQGFNIRLVTFDGFQSTDCMQILQKRGYRAEYLSLDRTILPYQNFKAAINEDRIDYYLIKSSDESNPSPSEWFIREAMQLEEIKGQKVDHPPKGSKDVCDAVAGMVHNVIENHKRSGGVQAKIVRG